MRKTIQELANTYVHNDKAGVTVLSEEHIANLLLASVEYLNGYQRIINSTTGFLDLNTMLEAFEWYLVKPLFCLYVERESAMQIEASRGMGMDTFGRSVSEIQQDIKEEEQLLPQKAFCREAITI